MICLFFFLAANSYFSAIIIGDKLGEMYMRVRDYSLPAGWYPRDPEEVSRFLSERKERGTGRAAVSPHAGWYYSGRIASRALASLGPDAQTVAVFGGHLSDGSPPLFALEDAVKTPFGHLQIDGQLRSVLFKELNGAEDRYRDNTVEVLLPMVHFFFPDAALLWMRLPAGAVSEKMGKALAKAAVELDRKVSVIASTDLTHYGRNYGFSPKGSSKPALAWTRDVNDAAFIRAVESGSCGEVLNRAERDGSACSAGAVLGAMGFAQAADAGRFRLLEYGTSADMSPGEVPDSFVGYAAMGT
jgi:AmmeMemoRadiSam system protein B